jgi:DNA-binding LacI/PurR family transcriptional regulator
VAVVMEDIAKTAGVSRSTVSRALADSSRVKLETRQEIQHLAQEMGYVPNAVARGLITRRSYALGVVRLGFTDAYPAELVEAIDEAARKSGYRIVPSRRGTDAKQGLADIKLLLEQQVEAIVVIESPFVDEYLSLLANHNVPVILLYSGQHPYSLGTDNISAARLAVEHLQDLGHERIAFIGSSTIAVESRERQLGYEQALQQRGVTPDPDLIVTYDDWVWAEGGYKSVSKLLRLTQPPTAVFCWNDETAIGVLGGLGAAGLHVPKDMSLVGFDNISLVPYLNPPLTTIAQPKERIAELTMQVVLNLIAGDEIIGHQKLPGRLIVRGSTAPPGG